MHRTKSTLSALLTTVTLATSAHGQLFSDDFESYNPGAKINNYGPWSTASVGTAGVFIFDDATATPFGTTNQYLDFNDNSTASVRLQTSNIAAAAGAVTTYAFDFNEPTTGGGAGLIVGYSIPGGDLTTGGSRWSTNLDDGTITGLSGGTNTYTPGVNYRLYIILNDTSAAVSYNAGGNSIPAGAAHVWVEPSGGPAVFAGSRNALVPATPAPASSVPPYSSYRVGLRSFSTNQQQVLIDNLALYEGVALPGNPPSLAGSTPADDSTTALASANLVANFSHPVVAGTGNVTIKESDGDATVATLSVTGPEVTFSGNTMTIDPPTDLANGTSYYVLIDAGAITDAPGTAFAEITSPDTWNFKTATPASRTSRDLIVGRAEVAASLGYLENVTTNKGQVGGGGGSGTRRDFNVILGFTLPTLPVGETVSSATFDFEIVESRQTGNDPALHVYLVDEEAPQDTGIDLFYQGADDPNEDTEFVGSLNLVEVGTGNNAYPDDKIDRSLVLGGDALALLQSYYGGDNVPDRTEAFFRFNLNQLLGGATISTFERYFIDLADDESLLRIGSETAAPVSPYDVWAAANSNPGGPTENGDTDPLNNLLEFAFGTNPIVNDNIPLSWAGTGNDVVPGSPATSTSFPIEGGVDFTARFLRRKDHGSAGSVSYTWRFSSDLMDWESSADTPTWFVAPVDLADDASGDYDLVEVPYPLFLASGKKARFFQVVVTTP